MGRVTLNDVSKVAGVSRATASLVVRGSSRISPATTARVQQAMKDLGYVYDRAAAQMRGAKTMTIGVIVPEIRNPYLADLLMTIEHSLRRRGYTSLISHSAEDIEREAEILATLAERRVDGILVHPAHGYGDAPLDRYTSRFDIPIVTMMRHLEDRFSYVGPDNQLAARLLGEHLRSLGVRSVALVGGPARSSARTERIAGMRAGLGADIEFDSGDATTTQTNYSDAGQEAMAHVFDQGSLPDAVVGYSDIVAMGMYVEIHRRGLQPGRDVAVAGFDDIVMSSWLNPPLTSVAMWSEQVGTAASELMLSAIDDGLPDPPVTRLIEPALRLRSSTLGWRPRRTD